MATHNSLTRGIIAYWPMTEAAGATRVDVVAGNFSLTDTGTVGQTPFNPDFNPTVQLGQSAVITSPLSQYLSRASGADLASAGRDMTLCAWFRIDAQPGVFCQIIGKSANEANGYDLNICYGNTGNIFSFVGFGTASGGSQYTTQTGSGVYAGLGRWGFAVARWKYGSVLELKYNNGDWKSIATPLTPNATSVSRFAVGGTLTSGGATNFGLTGAVCNAGIWSRLLSDAECGDLWNGGFGNTYDFSYPDA